MALKYLAAVAAAALALLPSAVSAAPAWEQWQSVGGIFDLAGPRSDGTLLVAGSGALYTLTSGAVRSPFAGGFHDDPGTEAYLTVSTGIRMRSAGCNFPTDDVYVLRLHSPIGVTRINSDGTQVASLADIDMTFPNGIAFDTSGLFDNALLVTGTLNGKTEVAAIDCAGHVQFVTRAAPVAEGGLAVAPRSFGSFAGDLIAPDELSGVIWAIGADGTSTKLVDSGLPIGQDIGVESVAFVPSGFTGRGGYVYYSDRATAGNPHPGTDHVLRLASADLVAAGVQDGDMLAASEGGAEMIAVRCSTSCQVIPIVSTPTTAHGEGHLVFTVTPQPSPTPTPKSSPSPSPVVTPTSNKVPVGAFVALLAAIIAGVSVSIAVAARRRRP